MLRSTYRANNVVPSALPPGWSEHRAPTGHVYYYNAETKQSTYTRPVAEPAQDELLIDYGATQPDRETQASMSAMQEFYKNSHPSPPRTGHFTGGRCYQTRDRDHTRLHRQGDRAKSKRTIPKCAPWVLVKTKYGRRFVHNPETNESFWKFPSDVMMAVIEMDRVEWEQEKQSDSREGHKQQDERTAKQRPSEEHRDSPLHPHEYDSDEYEEVEVTDDEADGNAATDSKRPRLGSVTDRPPEAQPATGPQAFDEDDIGWQLAQIEAEEDDPGYDYDYDDQEGNDGGIPLTREDREALFRNLLDEFQISPFSTFDALIDTNTPTANAVISDDRWVALPNMSSRRAAFDIWSRDRVAAKNLSEDPARGESSAAKKAVKLDPRIAYLRFLSKEATPKLYWPEFKRKFRKASEMTDRYFLDKEREKLYREYIAKLKVSETDRRKDFMSLLKTVPANEWKDGNTPASIEKDLRYYGIRDEGQRSELVKDFISMQSNR